MIIKSSTADKEEWTAYYQRFNMPVGKAHYNHTKDSDVFKIKLIAKVMEDNGTPFLIEFAQCRWLSKIVLFNAAMHHVEGSIDVPLTLVNPYGVPLLEYTTGYVMDELLDSPVYIGKYHEVESYSYDVASAIVSQLNGWVK
jgi:hypothetical protein